MPAGIFPIRIAHSAKFTLSLAAGFTNKTIQVGRTLFGLACGDRFFVQRRIEEVRRVVGRRRVIAGRRSLAARPGNNFALRAQGCRH